MILDNHGIITTAYSIEKANYKHYYIEKAIEIEVKTLSTGQKIRQIPQEISKKTAEQFARINTSHLEFEVFKTLTKKYR
ncbi:aldolase, partial [Francisella tularensis subsp. holarctica]|nr:aldolase [Francisella tularensis subsp. holarctica]